LFWQRISTYERVASCTYAQDNALVPEEANDVGGREILAHVDVAQQYLAIGGALQEVGMAQPFGVKATISLATSVSSVWSVPG
jgi:hypothetical protein